MTENPPRLAQKTTRSAYAWVWRMHATIGVLMAPVLIVTALTGALYVFRDELRARFLLPEVTAPSPGAPAMSPNALAAAVAEAYPGARLRAFYPAAGAESARVSFSQKGGGRKTVYVDPVTGACHAEEDAFFKVVLDLHRRLMLGTPGRLLVEAATGWGLLALFSGLYLWWARRRRPGSWWLRRTDNPRLRLRDKHVVAGLYVAPLLLITVSTGLLFSKLSGTVVRGGTALTGALPRALVKPPKSTPIDGAPDIDLDTVFAAAAQYGGTPVFRVLMPRKPDDAVRIQGDVSAKVWRGYALYLDRHSGALLDRVAWSDMTPIAKLLMLGYPLHTGTVGGVATKLLALASALTMVWLGVSGLLLWRRRGAGLPILEQAGPAPRGLLVLSIAVLVLLPASAASLLLFAGGLRLTRRWRQRRKGAPTPVVS